MSRLSKHDDADGGRRPSGSRSRAEQMDGPTPQRKRKLFVLCFDGTGNKFNGTDADSNSMALYRDNPEEGTLKLMCSSPEDFSNAGQE